MQRVTRKTIEGEEPTSRARRVRLTETTVPSALERATHAFAQEGLASLSRIDLRDTLERQTDRDIGPYWLIEVCHPALAAHGLSGDRMAGLDSCRQVAVWQDGRDAIVATLARPPGGGRGGSLEEHVDRALGRLSG